MDINEARELLGEDYAGLSDEAVQALIELIYAVCNYIISTEMDNIDE